MSPLQAYLAVSVILFAIGFGGVVTRRNAIVVLMGVELMLNAANLNFIAFWKFGTSGNIAGYIFVLFSIAIAAAESAVGLALVILIYRHYKTTNLDETTRLHG
ncbi:MAG TPA: NADH-quinone oxidoreductase subunit NuoK [Verrucomicrobiae bacterium]|jgi:NADH-quinone oxidoreductase subunit K|nr:NADH-quinone oxidoreductase subunit NuoK [Verrucomicrobiae bacterium]